MNAETTPSEQAWAKGKELAENTLAQYKKTHGDYPRKVSYTFWSSEFIESEGATIAQVLYMLGVEPVRDAYGRVSDLRLIPSEQLGRPRVDVIVQTSGQFRDLAASRLALISRAVEMAAAATDDRYGNRVAESTVETERLMNVTLCGPKGTMETLTPEQVVVEIDAEDFSVATGQQNIACRLYVPSNGKIFALGSYVLQCRIESN